MRLKYAGLYLCYAALAFVVLVVLFGVVIHPMPVSGLLMFGFAAAIVGAMIQVGVTIVARLARLSKS